MLLRMLGFTLHTLAMNPITQPVIETSVQTLMQSFQVNSLWITYSLVLRKISSLVAHSGSSLQKKEISCNYIPILVDSSI